MSRPNDAPRLSIVIVHHATPDLLAACLDSIAASPLATPYEVLVLDNASDPPLAERFAEAWPALRLVRNRQNVGYSRAVNQGVRAARGELILVLNPDIELRGDAIGEMVRFLDAHPEAGIVGCRLLNADGTVQLSCRTFYDWKTLLWRRTPLGRLFPNSGIVRRHLMSDWDHASVREVDWLIGACLLVRREAIDRVGLMDERFFMYFEDVDWCYRMRQAGYKVFYVPAAEMMHHHRRESARSLDRRFLAHLLSMLRYADKWNRFLWEARKRRETAAAAATLVADLAAANAAFLCAFLGRNALRAHLWKPAFPLAAYQPFILFLNAILAVTFLAMGLYRSRVRSVGAEAVGPVVRGSFVAYLILTLATFLTGEVVYSRLVILAFFPLQIALVLSFREGLRRLERSLRRHAFDLRRVVLVGRGPEAERARAALESDPDLRYEIAGATGEGPGSLGPFESLPRALESHRIHEVVIADPSTGRDAIERFLLAFRRLPVQVTVVLAGDAAGTRRGHLQDLGADLALVFDRGTRIGIARGWQRAADLAVGAPLALLALPIVALLSLPRLGLAGGSLESHRYELGDRALVLYTLRRGRSRLARFGTNLPRVFALLSGSLSLVGVPPEWIAEGRRRAPEIPAGLVPFWSWARRDPPADETEWERLARGYRLRWSPGFDLTLALRAFLWGGSK